MQNNIFNTLKQKYFSTEKRFLGIDYGDVNIGVAVSDVGRQIASPYAMLKNKSYKDLFPEIKKNFGFGCMRLKMDGENVDYNEFKRWLCKKYENKTGGTKMP